MFRGSKQSQKKLNMLLKEFIILPFKVKFIIYVKCQGNEWNK